MAACRAFLASAAILSSSMAASRAALGLYLAGASFNVTLAAAIGSATAGVGGFGGTGLGADAGAVGVGDEDGAPSFKRSTGFNFIGLDCKALAIWVARFCRLPSGSGRMEEPPLHDFFFCSLVVTCIERNSPLGAPGSNGAFISKPPSHLFMGDRKRKIDHVAGLIKVSRSPQDLLSG